MKKLDAIAAESEKPSSNPKSPLEQSVAARFGCLPNFFRLASADPQITANLWGFAEFAYLDNPLPSLFKERLFVYVSRFCEIRYCIARHLGFLVGLGRPAGDANCLPQTVAAVLPLLRFPLPHGDALEPLLRTCGEPGFSAGRRPAPDSADERALFACATHVFLQTPDAARALAALRKALDPADLEHLKVFLSFIRMAHYWTKVHPELVLEDDVVELLKTHEALAAAIFNDPAAEADSLNRQIAAELVSLRELRQENATITAAFETLTVDHRFVEQSLRDRDTILRELLAAIPAAVYACDSEGRLVYYNQHAVALWGLEPQSHERAWSFLKWRRLYRADGTAIPPEEDPVRGVLASGARVINEELILERPDSSHIDVLLNIAPLRDPAGRPGTAVCIAQDISK